MPLQLGSRLGQYEVTALLGTGGMGEVYRARDTRLNRDVALKVLSGAVTADADRGARLEREAQLLASLNHPNIAAIHGVEDASGRLALVMELVEGSTLADRLAVSPLPEEEAIAIAAKICDGLEYAHDRGIVHRDLKPANIKVTPEGSVKILDFGLAKALDEGKVAANISQSPTLTIAATRAGVILGTAAYMSPEQARGQSADRRSDIWAFGCVLFEMLTGKQVFEGDTISDTIAGVLRSEAPWDRLPPRTPPSIVRLLHRCLQKDPRQRLQHIGDARLELLESKDVAVAPSLEAKRQSLPILAAGAVLIAAVAGASGWLLAPDAAPGPITRFSVPIPEGALTTTTANFEVALSPDGRTLLFSGPGLGVRKRSLDQVAFEPLRGAEEGAGPFFSSDGAWVGFLVEGKIKKVPVEGGLPTTIGDVPFPGRAAWGDDGSIVLGGGGGLFRISDAGGALEEVLKAPDGVSFGQPRVLPGSKAVLIRVSEGAPGSASGRIEAVELATGQRHSLVSGLTPQLGPGGDLLFQQDGGLWAMRFNASRLEVEGAAVRVVESIHAQSSGAPFATASDGSLAYISGGASPGRALVWLDRAGRWTPAVDVRAEFQSPRISPDGKAVALSIAEGPNLDLWRYDFERGTRLRLTTDGRSRRSVWSPDGTQIAFYAAEETGVGSDLYSIPSIGGESRLLLHRSGLQFPDSWSPDGRSLLFEDGEGLAAGLVARRDLWVLPTGGGEPQPFLVTRFYERGAVFSPNGKWVAFVTDESGRPEVYVQPFPGSGPKLPVSSNGGLQPVWSRNGRELFYREGDSLMTAAIEFEPLRSAPPEKLFDFPAVLFNMDLNFADYDVAPDGRFLAIRNENSGRQSIQVVLNWREQLRQALGR